MLAADDPPKVLPSFDDGVIALLKLIGITSPIIGILVVLGFSISSWFDAYKSGREYAAKAGVAYRTAIARFSGKPSILAVIATVSVLLAQGIVGFLSFIYGNLLSID